MTPLGERLREMRARRGLQLKHMAAALGVSAAYLSALEHGRRGKPGFALMQAIIAYFNVIWDEADELKRLADLSDPRVTVDTGGLDARATLLANRLAREIAFLREDDLDRLLAYLDAAKDRPPAAPDA